MDMSSEFKLDANIQLQLPSDIDSIIEKALNQIKPPLPPSLPPALEQSAKNSNHTNTASNTSNSNTTHNARKHNKPSGSKKKSKSSSSIKHTHTEHTVYESPPRKHLNKVTWENCHSFTADCHICALNFNDYEGYCAHLKHEHYDRDDNDLLWLTCDICGKSNAHKSNFISHLASHTGNKPFKCRIVMNSGEFCATEASTRQNLQTHILKVHKLSVKHKLQLNNKRSPKRHKNRSSNDEYDDDDDDEDVDLDALTTPKRKRKRNKDKKKKKKKSKKRKYGQIDENINVDDEDFVIKDLPYEYKYKPRKSKRRRGVRPIPMEIQKTSPYCNPLEILIAAATFVEMNNISMQNNVQLTQEDMKKAAKHWRQILDQKTIDNLQNIAHQIDDISTTEQIYE